MQLENNGNIDNALQGQNPEEIAAVIITDNSGNKLFTDAIEKNMEAVEQICSKIYQLYVPTGNITDILENKALSSILQATNRQSLLSSERNSTTSVLVVFKYNLLEALLQL